MVNPENGKSIVVNADEAAAYKEAGYLTRAEYDQAVLDAKRT